MGTFTNSVRHCARNLFTFSGRDRPRLFWPYAGLVIGAGQVLMLVAVSSMIGGMFERMERFAQEHPDQVTVEQGPGHYSMQVDGYHPELMPDMRSFFILVAAITLVSALLLAAAITRRLHDRGRTGWWAAALVPFLAIGFTLMIRLRDRVMAAPDVDAFQQVAGTMMLLFANNMIYLGLFVFLIFQLVNSGTPGPNRYGPDPLAEPDPG
jgi:uncharacterized membrane protein YhaH (DUF805 family)